MVIYCLKFRITCYVSAVTFIGVNRFVCMDFALNECLHNTKLPIRYNSCEVDESLELNSCRVVSEHCELRTIRARKLTVKLGRAIKLSLNRRGSKAVRFGLQKVPALFCEKLTNSVLHFDEKTFLGIFICLSRSCFKFFIYVSALFH